MRRIPEGNRDFSLLTAIPGKFGIGGALSVRAVVVNPPPWIGNRGGQGTARLTRACAKVKLNAVIKIPPQI